MSIVTLLLDGPKEELDDLLKKTLHSSCPESDHFGAKCIPIFFVFERKWGGEVEMM